MIITSKTLAAMSKVVIKDVVSPDTKGYYLNLATTKRGFMLHIENVLYANKNVM